MDFRAKKKVIQEGDGLQGGLEVDPLEELNIQAQSYDVAHQAFIYFDNTGERVWTKGYFNNSEKGEKSIEITRPIAIKFIKGELSQDAMLSRYYPKQMTAYKKAINAAREQFLKY